MDRRMFLRIAGLSSLFYRALLRDGAAAAEMPVVALAEGPDYEKITLRAVAALGGMKRFVKKGDVVVIKPNIGWDRRPEQGATTHPLVVKALAEEALRAGAKIVKIFDRTCNDERRCYATSGMAETFKHIKQVELKYVEEERFKNVTLNGKALREWKLYDEALNADVFINVPVAKHHETTRLTLALKNIMGVMGGNRGSIHRNIDQALVDVNTVLKSHLVVIDATRILFAHGPQGGDPADVRVLNKVLASTDIVAADACATKFFRLNPTDIGAIVAAYRRGLGEMNLSRIRLVQA